MQQLLVFIQSHPILVILFLGLLAMLARSYLGSSLAKNISNMEAVNLLNKDEAWILDVRTKDEFEKSHISNSQNISLDVLANHIQQYQDKKAKPVILVCQSGNRSLQAAKILKKQAFEKLYNLTDGILGWQNANLPVDSGTNKPKQEKKKSNKKSGKQLNKQPDNQAKSENTHVNGSQPLDSDSPGEIPENSSGLDYDTSQLSEQESLESPDPMTSKILVYTAGYCPYTTKVEKLLERKGLEYEQVNVDDDPAMRDLIFTKSNQNTFPQVFLGDNRVGNCDELHQMEREGQLDAVFGIKASSGN